MLTDLVQTTEHLLKYEYDQRITRARAALDDGTNLLDNVDLQIELGTIDTVINEHFTQMQRAQIIMSTWAVLESGIHEISEYIADEKKVSSKIPKNRNGAEKNWLNHFQNNLDYPLHFSREDIIKISSLRKLRNVLVHSHIRSERLKEPKTKILENYQGVSVESYGLINIDSSLVESYAQLIKELLSHLIKRVCSDF